MNRAVPHGMRRRSRRLLAVAGVAACLTVVQSLALLSDSEEVTANELASAPCFASRVRSVQHGTTELGAAGATTTAIDEVDPTRTLVVHSLSSTSTSSTAAIVGVELADARSLRLTRADAGGTVTVAWSVVEYACGVRVQHGRAAGTGSRTADVAIRAVSTSRAFALVSPLGGGTLSPGTTQLAASLPDGLTLRLEAGASMPSTARYAWQVVEFVNVGDAAVQRVTGTIGASATAVDVALPSQVDPTRTLLLGAATGSSLAGTAVRTQLVDGGTVRFTRALSAGTASVSAWVVELGDGSTVEHGSVTVPAGSLRRSVDVAPVDPTTTSVLGTTTSAGGQAYGSTTAATGLLPSGQAVHQLDDPGTVTLHRGVTDGTATFALQVVQWGGPRWWNAAYGVRQRLVVEGAGTDVPEGYTTSVVLDHAQLVADGLSRADGADLRIARFDGTSWTEIDRVLDVDSAWNSASTTLWFRTDPAIGGGGIDGTYWVYSGAAAATGPPADPAAVWLYTDSFEDGDLDEYTDQPVPWYEASAWTRRVPITVPAGSATADLTDFPVLVQLTDAGLVGVARDDGRDLRFALTDGTRLSHELVGFDPATGAVRAWVELPSLPAASDVALHLYAGAVDAADQQDLAGTWSNDFVAVWHLDDPGGPVFHDSSPQDLDALSAGGVTATGSGVALPGAATGRIDVGPAPAPRDAATISAFVTATGPGGTVLARGTTPDWRLGLDGAGIPTATIALPGRSVLASGPGALVGPGHLALRADRTDVEVLLDGVAGVSLPTGDAFSATVGAQVAIGALQDGTLPFSGSLREVRVSSVTRSDAWLAAEAAMMAAPTTFAVAGPGETGTWFAQGTWTARVPLEISASATDTAVTHFPLLVRTTAPSLIDHAAADGRDLVVTTSDGVTRVPHELEQYDPTTGRLRMWVRVPAIAADGPTLLYVYAGNPDAEGWADPGAVFEGHETVLHLDEDPGGTP